jgi:MbtH protein
MAWDEEEDTTTYRVIVDGKQQVSLLPAGRKPPAGWREAGFAGKKQACLDHIKRDLRALRLVSTPR